MAQLVKIGVQFSAPLLPSLPSELSKSGATSEERLEEEEEEKAVWAEEEGGGGGGVEEALVPQLHLKGGGVFWSCAELEDGGGVGPALLVPRLDYHLIIGAGSQTKECEMPFVGEA